MNEHFDVFIIGTGVAATTVGFECSNAGLKVGIADSRPFGGTCSLRGCDAKKILVGAAEAIDWCKRMDGKGIISSNVSMNWNQLIEFKNSIVKPNTVQLEESLKKADIRSFSGVARFLHNTALSIGNTTIEANHFVIATGAKPQKLGIPGENIILTSDQFLELSTLPSSIVFIGGGYISFEFAHIAARCGSHGFILERGDRPLKKFDPDLVSLLVKKTESLGFSTITNCEVVGIEQDGKNMIVHAHTPTGESSFNGQLVVHGAGRIPALDELNLQNINVDFSPSGIIVNSFLQSKSNPSVYAAGDVVSKKAPPLTPTARYDGTIVAHNILHDNPIEANYGMIPSVVFTIPPLGCLGLTEDAAKQNGYQVKSSFKNIGNWYFSRRIGENSAAFKCITEEKTDKILGVHFLGPGADDILNAFTLALKNHLSFEDLKKIPYVYPSVIDTIRYLV